MRLFARLLFLTQSWYMIGQHYRMCEESRRSRSVTLSPEYVRWAQDCSSATRVYFAAIRLQAMAQLQAEEDKMLIAGLLSRAE